MLGYYLISAFLTLVLAPFNAIATPVDYFLGLSWVSDNPDLFSNVAAHGGVVSSSSPLHVFFSSFGIANRFLPIREYFLYILPYQLLLSGTGLLLAALRVLLRFVPTLNA
jgi:hypothetical protein